MFALIACAAPEDTGATVVGDDTAADTAALPEAAAAPPPAWGAATVGENAQSIFDGGLPDARSVLADWRDLFALAGDPCPGQRTNYSLSVPFEGCAGNDGTIWAGYAVYSTGADAPVDLKLEADAWIQPAGQDRFLAAGRVELEVDDAGTFRSDVVGTWGGSHLDDWTAEQPSVAVYADGDADTVAFFGGIGVTGGDAVYVDDGAWDAATCPGGTGTVHVRDPGGWWYAIALDAACTGCGPVTYEGEALGETCLDLAPLFQAFVARVESEP